eukprot:12931260-Prorocentrum_lima.AAC.1
MARAKLLPRNAQDVPTDKVDGTCVLIWKKVRKEVQGQQSWGRIAKGSFTAREFKDLQAYAENIETYS